MKTEKHFTRKLRSIINEMGGLYLYTFESMGGDIPDLYAVAPGGKAFWIEAKAVDCPRQRIPFRKGQPKWLEDHSRLGGKSFVLVYDRRNDCVWTFKGAQARRLVDVPLGELQGNAIGILPISPGDSWVALRDRLLEHA